MATTKRPTLTKTELTKKVAEALHNDVSAAEVRRVLDALQETTVEELRRGRDVTIPGLVKMRVAEKGPTKARDGINPATGQPLRIPAKRATRVVRARILAPAKEASSRR